MPLKALTFLLLLALCACNAETIADKASAGKFSVPYEKFELDNGLDVVLHVDKSDPVVAVALTAHVGSAREKEGRTGFASRLTQELREGKGYTYGIRSGFSGSKEVGEFQIGSGVRSNVTLESAQAVKKILEDYPETFSEKDLETTRSFLTKSNARAFETAGAKLRMLDNMSEYGWKAGYVKEREAIVRGMSQKKIKQLAEQYLKPGEMIWLVVGDAATQADRMKELGYGEVVRLN